MSEDDASHIRQAMRNRTLRDGTLGLVLAMLALAGGVGHEAYAQPSAPSTPSQTEVATLTGGEAPAQSEPARAAEEEGDGDLANAPVQPISTEKPLPANVKPSAPVAEVIRLAESGVDQSVVLAYVSNSTSTFHLSAEEIIYLNDIGIPGNVVTAMIQHDQASKGIAPVTILPPAPQVAAEAPPAVGYSTDAVPPPNPNEQYAPAPEPSAPPIEISAGEPPPEYPNEGDGPPPDVANDSAFYDSLAPYGTWVNVGGYGNCWQPSAASCNPNWQPYFNCGRWVYSDCGWYWMSGYSWGWAPFHYGRWFRHNQLGWCWSPGSVWAPSWVAWRYSAGYCGWAPLPPCAWYRPGIGLTYRGHTVASTFGFGLTPQSYAFVAFKNFYNGQLPTCALPPRQVAGFYSSTTFSTTVGFSQNRVINNGLPPKLVAAGTHTPTHRVAIHEVSRTGATEMGRTERFASGGTALSVFRPLAPQSAGSKVNATVRPPSGSRGNSHSFNAPPKMGTSIVLHGAEHPTQSGSSATVSAGNGPTVVGSSTHATTWKDIPRTSTPGASASDAASYQRWQQRIQPAQTPWYLPNASSSASHTSEKTSRMESRQTMERTTNSKDLTDVGSRYDRTASSVGSAARQWQYSTPKDYEVPRSAYNVPQSAFAPRQTASPEPSPSFTSRPDVSQPRAMSAPVQTYVAPVSHPVVSQPAPVTSPSGGAGRGWR